MKRTRKEQQQAILAAMLEEARQRCAQGLPLAEVRAHVAQVRDDLTSARRQGFTVTGTPLTNEAQEEVRTGEYPHSIKALSIRQPYASWLVHPDWFLTRDVPPKRIENRDWSTRYRGPLLIHAPRTVEADAFAIWSARIPGLDQCVRQAGAVYPTGAIIGIANLVDCVEASDDPWFCGDYGLLLADARPIVPIPYPGALHLFEVPIQAILSALSPDEQNTFFHASHQEKGAHHG